MRYFPPTSLTLAFWRTKLYSWVKVSTSVTLCCVPLSERMALQDWIGLGCKTSSNIHTVSQQENKTDHILSQNNDNNNNNNTLSYFWMGRIPIQKPAAIYTQSRNKKTKLTIFCHKIIIIIIIHCRIFEWGEFQYANHEWKERFEIQRFYKFNCRHFHGHYECHLLSPFSRSCSSPQEEVKQTRTDSLYHEITSLPTWYTKDRRICANWADVGDFF